MLGVTERHPAPWLFGITVLPYGVYYGFIGTAMPYLLRNSGVAVDRIAGISALALAPAVWYFVWAPLADIGLRRRSWLMLTAALSAFCLLVAMRLPLPSDLNLFVALVVAGSAFSTIVAAANGGLMAATLEDDQRGHASGWFQAGYTGGGAVGAGATLWLSSLVSPHTLSYAVALMVFVPSLTAFQITEPKAGHKPGMELFAEMFRDLKVMFTSRTSLAGLGILLCPLGAAAAANLFSGIARDYHASANTVVWITGFGGGVFTALGSLAGGFVADRIPRRLAYALAALVSSFCAAGMLISPPTQPTFAVGASLYLIAMGLSFATYQALTLELVGPPGRSASTRQSLYAAAGNAPVMYMTWIDGQGYKRFGTRGLLGTDALSNVIAASLVLFLIRRTLFTKAAPLPVAPMEGVAE
jgi:MFS transporter, PAT family, beta-lactamase induction signal transducer AmpG